MCVTPWCQPWKRLIFSWLNQNHPEWKAMPAWPAFHVLLSEEVGYNPRNLMPSQTCQPLNMSLYCYSPNCWLQQSQAEQKRPPRTHATHQNPHPVVLVFWSVPRFPFRSQQAQPLKVSKHLETVVKPSKTSVRLENHHCGLYGQLI